MFGFNFDRRTLYMIIGIIVVMSLMSLGASGIASLILSIPAVLLAITVHEFGHAFAAYKLGDDTPVRQGRLSLNPLDHVDPLGLAMLLFIRIGWGKPVQVDPRNYNRNITVEKADAIVSFAGPLMNFITAIIFSIITCIILKVTGSTIVFYGLNMGIIASNSLIRVIIKILINIVITDIGLGIFNMIPLPPLDGSKIFLPILPRNAKYWFIQHEQMFYFIFLFIWITGIAGSLITPMMINLSKAILSGGMSIFGI